MHFVFKFTWTSFNWEYFKNDMKLISNLSGFVWTWSKRRIHVVSFEGGHPLIERAGMFIENVKRNPLLCERLINS